jgi:hypothetical protein
MDIGAHTQSPEQPGCCPFLQMANPPRGYRIPGYCTGLLDDELMIPSLYEHRTFCSSPNHVACPTYRYRCGGSDWRAAAARGAAGDATAPLAS